MDFTKVLDLLCLGCALIRVVQAGFFSDNKEEETNHLAWAIFLLVVFTL